MRAIWTGLLCLAPASAVLGQDEGPAAAVGQAPAEERSPNVIYILADDLGYGELGSYGQAKLKTPHLDGLASEGMRFTRHYSGSTVCAPSRCVLLTGQHTGHAIVRNNWENGGWGPDEPEGQFPLPAGTRTLAGLLQANGYKTAAIGKWGLGGPGTSGHPNQQGFDTFYGYLCQRQAHNYYPTHLWLNEKRVELEGNEYFKSHQQIDEPLDSDEAYWERYTSRHYAPDTMIQEAMSFIREHAEEPFFLFYASPLPHVALQGPPEDLDMFPAEWDTEPYLGQKGYLPHPSPRRAYAAMIWRLDFEVGLLLDLIDELGLADDTIVMFSSDNGPTYAGGVDYPFFDSTGGLRGRKGNLYEGGVRVPMLARWPDRIPAGSTSDHVSGFQDVLPTLLELTGGQAIEQIDGLSFAPTLLGRGEQAEHDYLYWEHGGKQAVLLVEDNWKAVRSGLDKGDPAIAVYRLDEDPQERENVAAQHPELVRQLEKLFVAARTPSADFPLPGIDER